MKHRTFMIERTLPVDGGDKVYYGGMDRCGSSLVPYWADKSGGQKYLVEEIVGNTYKMLKDQFGFLNLELHIIELPEEEWVSY